MGKDILREVCKRCELHQVNMLKTLREVIYHAGPNIYRNMKWFQVTLYDHNSRNAEGVRGVLLKSREEANKIGPPKENVQ